MQYNLLFPSEKKALDLAGVIMIEPNISRPVRATFIGDIYLPRVIISKNLVPDYMDRYYIAHYLRNRINYIHIGAYEWDSNKRFHRKHGIPYYFPGYDEYIIKNAEIICNVFYHFISSCFNEIYPNWLGLHYLLIEDELLGEHLDMLKEKLETETKFFNWIVGMVLM